MPTRFFGAFSALGTESALCYGMNETPTQEGGEMKKPTVREIRARYGIKGGRVQISAHGCGRYSVQVFRAGRLAEDFDVKA